MSKACASTTRTRWRRPPLYVVCDGMGGHAAGKVASEIAVDVICDRAPRTPRCLGFGPGREEANLAIIRAAREGVGRAGMGCTCTAAMLEKDKLVIAQVGDSRAYLLHKGQMQQLTRDHSLVADLIEAGQITEAEARVHPQRSVITRALGSDPRTQPDLFELTVEAGDRLLLCSDGLSTMLEDDQIAKILASHSEPQRCAAQLVNEAVGRGGYDNVTVIVVDVTGLAEQHRRKLTRKSRATAIMLALLLVAIIAGCAYGFNYLASNAAYLVAQDGKVAVYQGVPGDLFGLSFNHLDRVTDVALDDLQPGTANRLREEGIKVDSWKPPTASSPSTRRRSPTAGRRRGGGPGSRGQPAGRTRKGYGRCRRQHGPGPGGTEQVARRTRKVNAFRAPAPARATRARQPRRWHKPRRTGHLGGTNR